MLHETTPQETRVSKRKKKSRLEEVEVQRALGLKTEEGHSEDGVERARSHRDKTILRGKEQSLGQQL